MSINHWQPIEEKFPTPVLWSKVVGSSKFVGRLLKPTLYLNLKVVSEEILARQGILLSPVS